MKLAPRPVDVAHDREMAAFKSISTVSLKAHLDAVRAAAPKHTGETFSLELARALAEGSK